MTDNPLCSGSGTGEGEFTASLTGLTPDTTYYIRAYATNIAGTVYGDQVSFATPKELSVTISNISSITSKSAEISADVIGDGGFPITARGICRSESDKLPALNINTSYCSDNGTGKGEFTASITGLTPNTTYYIRGYAANQKNTVYGTEISFKTKVISGDVNGDGKINLNDAILALKILSGIETAETIYSDADINNDGKIGIEEVIYILRKIM